MIEQKQPKGMYILAFTETFERLSFYSLSFLLILYASSSLSSGGLGWSKEKALALTSFYTMSVYTLPIFSSFIADTFLGHYRAVILGGCGIVLGHICIFFSNSHPFILYLSLGLVATGTSLLKPCMPALLGKLYKSEDTRREAGFSWYYVGINLGALVAGITSGLVSRKYGYPVALSTAGLGMTIGLIVFILGRKNLVIEKANRDPSKLAASKTDEVMTLAQKKALGCLGLAFVFFAIWAVVYNLALSGTLSLYIENYTNKNIFSFEIPTTFFQSLESFTILLGTPVITFILASRAIKGRYPHFFNQMNLAVLLGAVSVLYFAYLTFVGQNVGADIKPFNWTQIAFFIMIFSVSETIISPVMMSAISVIAPIKYKSLFQSFYLACFGLTSIIAGKIGAISLESPFETFLTLGIVISVTTLIYFFAKGKMISLVTDATNERISLAKAKTATSSN